MIIRFGVFVSRNIIILSCISNDSCFQTGQSEEKEKNGSTKQLRTETKIKSQWKYKITQNKVQNWAQHWSRGWAIQRSNFRTIEILLDGKIWSVTENNILVSKITLFLNFSNSYLCWNGSWPVFLVFLPIFPHHSQSLCPIFVVSTSSTTNITHTDW